jgi:hypothetical protein
MISDMEASIIEEIAFVKDVIGWSSIENVIKISSKSSTISPSSGLLSA